MNKEIFKSYDEVFANAESFRPSSNRVLDHPEAVIDMICFGTGDYRFKEAYNAIADKEEITMFDVYGQIFKNGYEKGTISVLSSLVKKGLLTIEQAAEEAEITVDEFKKQFELLEQ